VKLLGESNGIITLKDFSRTAIAAARDAVEFVASSSESKL
jgi:hypothetical protein